ncbi:hypothetical protein IAQ61_000646 [Plenodomus lingam]|uniref:Spindle pole body component n=1 Tax=Leptosphaeria maculans (strain JN3 / isolate v23.1.3 / race Av1-4-5-6-7-8) TaxID=985895 RepID=E5A6J4_LEPMJ|nr:similar to gamma-tubulin complex component GCP6 [Plenodomus lingam JN3]KAH9880355.1 hypothetical protein IAQ61_000646 [Plenodomus lingam]CBX99239.1 similar to gamma-tubulin complex component GCP6 [Plenodomus lingam JN3]
MLSADEVDNVFTTDHLWKPSTLYVDPATYNESALFAPLELDIASIRFDHPYAPKHDLEQELRLPDLETFEFGPLPDLASPDESSIFLEPPPSLEPEEDVWEAAFDLGPANKDVIFYTWEDFEKGHHQEHTSSPYITECGPSAFDAALVHDGGKIHAGRVLKSNVLLQSLWNLGLGRSSLLFHFNPKLKTFEPSIADGRPSGISLDAAQSLITQFTHTGNTFLYLRSFTERTFTSAASIPARVALATCVSSILSSLENVLGKRSVEIRSLIQLQHQFTKPREILVHVAKMVDAVKYAKTNEQLSSVLHHRLLESEEGNEYLRQLSSEMLRQVARPSLELIGEWIGITKEQAAQPIWARDNFVVVEDAAVEPPSLEFTYRSERMPRYIAPEDGDTVFEIGHSLHFLKTQHPEHPLASLHRSNITRPELEWGFAWQDVEKIASKAHEYEQDLRKSLLAFGKGSSAKKTNSRPQSSAAQDGPQDLDRYFEDSIRAMDAPLTQSLHTSPDELQLLVDRLLQGRNSDDHTDSNKFSPPLSLLSALSFRPLITAQAKLVNAATIRLFFRSHNLQLHLSLQRQYHLLGDGVFSSLLATALFDPNRESAERHKGQMRSGVHMGLQLGSRKTWPPASSELRLALRGVLSESYYSSALYRSSQTDGATIATDTLINGRDNDELPGQLNFAVRNLTEAEQEQVMDPDALSALDFLRLQYVAPNPLNMIITTSILDKYDIIFKFLLRLLRMLFVVSHLPRQFADVESRQLRMEAHHFVYVFANYVFQTGIAEHWGDFTALVDTLEQRIDEEDAAGELGTRATEGVASLRNAHERCLDSIMFSLLLRKRQRKIVALVEEIFDYILLFAKMQNQPVKEEINVKELYAKMRGKIRVFLSVCRGLTAKQGYGKGKGTAEENSMERLVLGMEMNGYFSGS